MANRFICILALIACALMILPLCAGAASAEEQAADFLGKPFPDFTTTDTEGNTFTLSEALKSHEAVLINFWATWCGPCLNEFPDLNEVYGKYGDKVAFIALTPDQKDTIEKIAAYRAEHGLDFPMARDENGELYTYIGGSGVPWTVIVDRFGNAVFCRVGAFTNREQVERVLNAILGEGYTESVVLDKIPADTSTRAFPVSAQRALWPESEGCRKLVIRADGYPNDLVGYIVPGDSVRIRIEIAADDNIAGMTYVDMVKGKGIEVAGLLDAERSVFSYDQALLDASAEFKYTQAALFDNAAPDDGKEVAIFLFRDEDCVAQLVKALNDRGGYGEFTWKYAEEEQKAGNAPQAYIVHVVDQDNKPVPEVVVNFCTDTACVPKESDENGTVTYTGEPAVYHVQIVDAPEGYSWDENYEMYTTAEYGEWVLRVKKD